MAGERYDSPNQEVVGSGHPSEDGVGGNPDHLGPGEEGDAPTLDDMTKDELIEQAGRQGVDVRADWTKAEIREAIEAS